MDIGYGYVLDGNSAVLKTDYDARKAKQAEDNRAYQAKMEAARAARMNTAIPSGTVIMTSHGDYDSYGITGLYRATRAFVPAAGDLAGLVNDGTLEPIKCLEWHLDGDISPLEIEPV